MRLFTVVLVTISVGACTKTPPVPAGDAPAAVKAEAEATAGTVAYRTTGTESTRPEDSTWREVTIPAGTNLPIVLDTTVGSDISRAEEPVQAHISRSVTVKGEPALPDGTRISGLVTDATRSGKVKGRAHIAVRFDTLVPRGSDERYPIQTAAVGRTAAATTKKDALEIGAPAVGGAIIGALVGGKKGAAVGTVVGGGAGTAAVLSTRGKEIHLAKGAPLTLRLTQPVTIRVRG